VNEAVAAVCPTRFGLATGVPELLRTSTAWTAPVSVASAHTHWHHHDLDQLSPDRVLGILQRAGRLHDYVRAPLGRALSDLSRSSQQGYDPGLSVALSPHAIAAPDLPQAVQAALEDHGLDPRRLTIALTHTTGIGHNPPLDAGLACTAGSYGMKHLVERAIGQYMPNGVLIAATLMAGYPWKGPHRPNVVLGMSKRHIDQALADLNVKEQ
jgi:hypothetical protein